jgi:hypothetical protein
MNNKRDIKEIEKNIIKHQNLIKKHENKGYKALPTIIVPQIPLSKS